MNLFQGLTYTNNGIINHADLLVFITGVDILEEEMNITFHSAEEKKLPEADSCFNRIILPVSHASYEEFNKACTTALEYGSMGYGRF